jgi:hypothetical protein
VNLPEPRSPALRDASDIPQGLSEPTGQVVQFPARHIARREEFGGMAEEVARHAQLERIGG